jgi:LysM repeat protein
LQRYGTPRVLLYARRAASKVGRMQRSKLAAAVAAAAMLAPSAAHAAVHTVAPGETLSGIAAVNGMSPATLAAANGLSPDALVIAGHTLRIPARGSSAPVSGAATTASSAAGTGGHLVVPGETLSGIASANGLSTAALAAANGLSSDALVIAGTRLRIPAAGTGTIPSASSGAPQPMGGYVVRWGDTLSALAARSGVSVGQVAYMNGLDPNGLLLAGTSIKLPTGSPVLSSEPVVPAGAPPAAPGAAPQATPGRVTSDQIRAIAAESGAPGSLAAAIAWQESGFNNAMVSSTSARGVMQVMPGTWDWVQTYLSGGRRLDPASPSDNVRAGTLYLAHLLRETGGDPALAAAGYYQGLASVRRSGMLPDTRRYVANVMALRSRFGG